MRKLETISLLHGIAVKAASVAHGQAMRHFCAGKRGEVEGAVVPVLVALGRLSLVDTNLYTVRDFQVALEAALKEERRLHNGIKKRMFDALIEELFEL